MKPVLTLERVYADPGGTPSDGYRIYVDRLWPRGESKEKFRYDLWAKDIAPSTELREWLHADPTERWDEFEKRYEAELAANPAVGSLLATIKEHPKVTLLYSSHDEQHNNAVVLLRYLESRL